MILKYSFAVLRHALLVASAIVAPFMLYIVIISRPSISDFLALGIVAGFALTMGWKPEHVIALVTAMVTGAAIGVVTGFSMSVYGHRGFSLVEWVQNWPSDAKMWAAIGAVVVGAVIYCCRGQQFFKTLDCGLAANFDLFEGLVPVGGLSHDGSQRLLA